MSVVSTCKRSAASYPSGTVYANTDFLVWLCRSNKGGTLPQGKNGRQVITSIDIKTHQSTQVVYLKPYNQADSYYRLLTSESSISAASSRETVLREGFETVDVKPVINFVVEVQLSQIGFSMVNRHLQVMETGTVVLCRKTYLRVPHFRKSRTSPSVDSSLNLPTRTCISRFVG